jgi:U4/U6.U5 tri-snRNP-associated protein 2
MLCRV